jgi:L-iditol 2-dehydrogenase
VKAAVYRANDDVRVEERPVPAIGPDELLVKIEASGICGSDVMEWYRKPKAPLVLGHEIAGTVAAAGAGRTRWREGDRVVVTHHVPCNTCRTCLAGHHSACETLRSTKLDPGGFAEYARVPALQAERGVVRIPDGVTFDEASFFEPLGCVAHGLQRAGLAPAASVAILGSGITGILMAATARALGAGRIVATDIAPERRAAIARFGADVVLDAAEDVPARIREENGGRGADLVVLCTAALPAIRQGLASVGPGGTILFFSVVEPGVEIPFPMFDLWRDDVTITTAYAAAPKDLATAAELIRSRRVPVAEMITHRLPLDSAPEGFRLVAEGRESIKVILRPHEAAG